MHWVTMTVAKIYPARRMLELTGDGITIPSLVTVGNARIDDIDEGDSVLVELDSDEYARHIRHAGNQVWP